MTISFGLRYDLRAPAFGPADSAALTAAAIEQSAWADAHGFSSITLSEHHGSEDGYLPSPMVVAAAIAARTAQLRLVLGALIVPLHDQLRLAEDLAVLDNIARGRLTVVVAGGYVAGEFEMFDRSIHDRGKLVDETIHTLRAAWTGEPFVYRGRTVRITPRPAQRPGPPILVGGAARATARRAATIGDGYMPTMPFAWDLYRDELSRVGKPDPGPMPRGGPMFLHIAEDPDAAWAKIAPHAMHEMNAYGKWMVEAGGDGPYSPVDDAEALRAMGMYRVLTPDQCVELVQSLGDTGALMFHPLMGGLDPDLAWESLHLFNDQVRPRI